MRFFPALLAGALLVCASAAAKPLELIVFHGGANWPVWVGLEKGSFASQGVEIHITHTPGSVFLVKGLVEGRFDLGFTTFDNVVGYDEGQGEARLDRPADLVAVLGGLTGGLRLVVDPSVHSFAELRGKSLAVDAPSTGYSLVLRKMLERGGLAPSDYRFENLGGTGERAEALLQGRTLGTILTSPIDIVPIAKGYRVLADSRQIGPYQATLFVARREWARAHEAQLIGFIRGYVEALHWLSDPAHREEAAAIYRKYLPKATDASARKAWDALLASRDEGLTGEGRIDMQGAATVVKLRAEYGEPRKALGDASKYVDESWYRKAIETSKGEAR